MSITIEDIHPVYRSAKRVTQKRLDKLEAEFGAELPRGYRSYLTTLGHGWLNDWLQIYCPDADLLVEQRKSLMEYFEKYTREGMLTFRGAKLKLEDIQASIQIGIDQDVMQLFACPRFPGSVFEWSGITITQHSGGVERLDPFAGMRMETFAYFFPHQPAPEYRSLACQSKKLAVDEVVQTIENLCKGGARVVDVDEGPDPGSRTPAFWLFPEKLGVKFHVYGVETSKYRRVYLTFGTSPKHLPKVESVIEQAGDQLGVRFKPARWH